MLPLSTPGHYVPLMGQTLYPCACWTPWDMHHPPPSPPGRTLGFYKGADLPLYIPVGVSSWHFPNLDAPQGPFASHHHAQVGVPVGVVALGLRGAVRSTGPTRGEQPLNCDTEGEAVSCLPWISLFPGLSPKRLLHGLRRAFKEGSEVTGRKTRSAIQTG